MRSLLFDFLVPLHLMSEIGDLSGCILADSLSVPAGMLYEAYRSWAASGGQRNVMSATAFGRKITARSWISKEHARSGWTYSGVGITGSDPDPDA